MTIKHGSYQRNPMWMWGALFTLGIILIPGAQLGTGHQQFSSPAPSEVRPAIAEIPAVASKEEEQTVTFVHSVKDLLDRIVADGLATPGNSNQTLLNMLQVFKQQPQERAEPVERVRYAQPFSEWQPLPTNLLPQPDGKYDLVDGTLTVEATLEVKKSVDESVARYRKYGFKQILLQFQFMEGPQELSVEGAQWSVVHGAENAELSEEQSASILERVKSSDKFNRLMAPQVMVINGQQANCSTSQSRAIKTELPNQPAVFSVIETGTWFSATPVLTAGGKVRLSWSIKQKVYWPATPASTDTVSSEHATECEIPLGKTLAIRRTMTDPSNPNQGKCLLTLVKCVVLSQSLLQ